MESEAQPEAEMHPQVAHLLTLPKHAQRSKEWFAQRAGRITASEVAAVLDIKPFATYSAYGGHPRREVLLRKAYPNDERFKFGGNAFTAHGVDNEDVACKKYEAATGRKVLEFGFLIHPTIPWLGASPDGITTDGVLIEVRYAAMSTVAQSHSLIADQRLNSLPMRRSSALCPGASSTMRTASPSSPTTTYFRYPLDTPS